MALSRTLEGSCWRFLRREGDRRFRSGDSLVSLWLRIDALPDNIRPACRVGSMLSQKRVHAALETEGNTDAMHESAAFKLHVEGPAEKIGVIVQRSNRQTLAVRQQRRNFIFRFRTKLKKS